MSKKNKNSLSLLILAFIFLFNSFLTVDAVKLQSKDALNTMVKEIKKQKEDISVEFLDEFLVGDVGKYLEKTLEEIQFNKSLSPYESQNIYMSNIKSKAVKKGNKMKILSMDLKVKYKNNNADTKYAKAYVKEKAKNWHDLPEEEKLRKAYNDVIEVFHYKSHDPSGLDERMVIKERNLKSGLEGNGVVCDGYTLLLALYFDELGFENKIALATITNDRTYGEKHDWNMVKTEHGWYHCDATWGDNPGLEDKYFLMTENESQSLRSYKYDRNIGFASNKPYPFKKDSHVSSSKGKLEKLLGQVEALDKFLYTDETLLKLDKAYKEAKFTFENEAAVEKDIDKVYLDLNKAYKTLKEKSKDELKINRLSKLKKYSKNKVYISGYEDRTFKGDRNMTRLESVKVLSSLLSFEDVSNKNRAMNFTDSKDIKWAREDVRKAVGLNIVSGYDDGTFRPNKNITRAEAVTMIIKFTGVEKASANLPKDVKKHWARDNISTAIKYGWINGYDDGSFRPDKNITRAEFVTIINKIIDRKVNIDFISLEERARFTDIKGKWYYKEVLGAVYPDRY